MTKRGDQRRLEDLRAGDFGELNSFTTGYCAVNRDRGRATWKSAPAFLWPRLKSFSYTFGSEQEEVVPYGVACFLP